MNIIDYSFARPGGAAIKNAGYTGVIRYLASSSAKAISSTELADLQANGISIALVFEDDAGQALNGSDQGVKDAQEALSQANALGFPSNLPIYFAVDVDVTLEQMTAVNEYLDGCAWVLGASRVGVYGGITCVENAHAAWKWQTLAWSGGKIASNIHIYQNGQQAFGGEADVDVTMNDNWGQWIPTIKPNPTPTPQPAPPTPPNVPDTYTVVSGDTLSGIGAKFNIPWRTIAELNNILSPFTIFPGQVLKLKDIPIPSPAGRTYVVKSGDTLSGIGAEVGVDWHTIAELNNIQSPYVIYPGEVLILGGSPSPAPTPETEYTIVSGDTLGKIASQFGTSVAQLVQWNIGKYPNMTENFIEAGWTIRVQ